MNSKMKYVLVLIQSYSEELQCKMKFSVIIPDQAKESKLPVLYWLSGMSISSC